MFLHDYFLVCEISTVRTLALTSQQVMNLTLFVPCWLCQGKFCLIETAVMHDARCVYSGAHSTTSHLDIYIRQFLII